MTTVYVHSGDEAAPIQVGLAYVTARKGHLSSTFAYSHEYLASRQAHVIDPEFPLQAGNWPARYELPGSLMDSTPDRWGRNLISKRYPGRRLDNLDYLLGVSDITRQGALRFTTELSGPFQHPDATVPRLVALRQLLEAVRLVESPTEGSEAVKFLLDAGSGSLGGARPKAAVDNNGRLYLAKFPHSHDRRDVITAEYDALQGARKSGIRVPDCQLVKVGDDNVLLVERFDRANVAGTQTRVPYISAMTAVGARDGEQRDYLDILDFITKHGSKPQLDTAELLRRIRYTIEIHNTDDHLRNHGFLLERGGWRLSPVFDINPNPNRNEQRQTPLGGHTDTVGSLRFLEELERGAQWGTTPSPSTRAGARNDNVGGV